MKVIAALDDSAAARPVLGTALALGELLGASVEALHVPVDDRWTARSVADEAGVTLREARGNPSDEIVAAIDEDDVEVAVLGARSLPHGRRPAGHVVLDVAQRTDTPIVIVPPDSAVSSFEAGNQILVPLDGTVDSARAVDTVTRMFARRGMKITVLHVFDESTRPSFWGRTGHEDETWGEEFLRRHCPLPGAQIHLRTGVVAERLLEAAAHPGVIMVALGWSQDLTGTRAQTVRQVLARCGTPALLVGATTQAP
jgi:nucleotide-binding universal stress UspA family protein